MAAGMGEDGPREGLLGVSPARLVAPREEILRPLVLVPAKPNTKSHLFFEQKCAKIMEREIMLSLFTIIMTLFNFFLALRYFG